MAFPPPHTHTHARTPPLPIRRYRTHYNACHAQLPFVQTNRTSPPTTHTHRRVLKAPQPAPDLSCHRRNLERAQAANFPWHGKHFISARAQENAFRRCLSKPTAGKRATTAVVERCGARIVASGCQTMPRSGAAHLVLYRYPRWPFLPFPFVVSPQSRVFPYLLPPSFACNPSRLRRRNLRVRKPWRHDALLRA